MCRKKFHLNSLPIEPEELGLEPIRVTPLLYNYLIKQQILNFRPNLPAGISAPAVYSFYIPKSLLDNDIFINECHFIGIFFGIDNDGHLAIILRNVKISDQAGGVPIFEGLGDFYLGSPSNNFIWTPISQVDAIACGYYIGDECLKKVLKKGLVFGMDSKFMSV